MCSLYFLISCSFEDSFPWLHHPSKVDYTLRIINRIAAILYTFLRVLILIAPYILRTSRYVCSYRSYRPEVTVSPLLFVARTPLSLQRVLRSATYLSTRLLCTFYRSFETHRSFSNNEYSNPHSSLADTNHRFLCNCANVIFCHHCDNIPIDKCCRSNGWALLSQ